MLLKKIKIRYLFFFGSIFLFIFLVSELLKIEKESKKNDVIPENIQKIKYYTNSDEFCYKDLGIKEISNIAKLSVLEINTMIDAEIVKDPELNCWRATLKINLPPFQKIYLAYLNHEDLMHLTFYYTIKCIDVFDVHLI